MIGAPLYPLLRPLLLILLLLSGICVASCGPADGAIESAVPTTSMVYGFSESGVYRLPASSSDSGALYRGDEPIPVWRTETAADSDAFTYVPVTRTRQSDISGLFWDAGATSVNVVAEPLTAVTAANAQTTAEHRYWYEEDISYQSEADMAFPSLWTRIVAPSQWQHEITVPEGLSSPSTLLVRLWAKTSMPADPDHHIQLLWDDELVGDDTWDGEGMHTISAPLPDISPGRHVLTVIAPGDTDAQAEVVFVDGWGISAQRLLDIRQHPLTWTAISPKVSKKSRLQA